jgi:hypothetical protein
MPSLFKKSMFFLFYLYEQVQNMEQQVILKKNIIAMKNNIKRKDYQYVFVFISFSKYTYMII